tara:strand:- start:2118 stop:3239 length:1122 start_codon:yes stop_codon:yes gene_type:complete
LEIRYNIKDLFKAPRSALNLTKILTLLKSNIVGYLLYFIANYFALFLIGKTFLESWRTQGFFPCAYIYDLPWYASILFWISSLYWFLAVYGAMSAVSKITIQELKGDYFYSTRDAHEYIKKNWYPIMFTPLSILSILVFYVIATSFFGFLTRIPGIGSLFLAIPFAMYLFGAIFAAFTFYVLIISIIFTPAIVGAIKEDTMGSVFNVYMIAWRFPIQITLYKLILLPLTYFSHAVLVIATGFGFKIMDLIFSNSLFMGDRFAAVISNAASLAIPKDFIVLIFGSFFANFYNYFIPSSFEALNSIEAASSLFIAIFLLLIVFLCFSYALSVFSSGLVIILNILKKSSGIDLIAKADKANLTSHSIQNEMNELNT